MSGGAQWPAKRTQRIGAKCATATPPPHSLPHAANVAHKYINLRPTLRIAASFRNKLVLAGIGSLAFTALVPLSTLAAPGITLKASFTGSNGASPNATLTAAGNGIYYGTTLLGGSNGLGSIFKFDSATGSITLQDSFTGSNGHYPYAALIAAGSGIYYGTTTYGGSNGTGSIFKFDSAIGSITLQDSFTGPNGAYPYAALTAAGSGIYYGTTIYGGSNDTGSIFKFDSATGSITLQDSFTGSNGADPYAALTAAGNGIYYGTTYGGGGNGFGSIFKFDSATGSITLQDSFTGSNGGGPNAALTAAGNGIYYGTTVVGGANGTGAIYAFDSGVRDSNPVPGPMPLIGATAAFGWSRRLRRRIQAVRPVFPIGR